MMEKRYTFSVAVFGVSIYCIEIKSTLFFPLHLDLLVALMRQGHHLPHLAEGLTLSPLYVLRWLILQKWTQTRAYPNGKNSKCRPGTKDQWNVGANHASVFLLCIRNIWIYMCESNIVLYYTWSNLILVPNNLKIFGEERGTLHFQRSSGTHVLPISTPPRATHFFFHSKWIGMM